MFMPINQRITNSKSILNIVQSFRKKAIIPIIPNNKQVIPQSLQNWRLKEGELIIVAYISGMNRYNIPYINPAMILITNTILKNFDNSATSFHVFIWISLTQG